MKNLIDELFPDTATTVYNLFLISLCCFFAAVGITEIYNMIWGDEPQPQCTCCKVHNH